MFFTLSSGASSFWSIIRAKGILECPSKVYPEETIPLLRKSQVISPRYRFSHFREIKRCWDYHFFSCGFPGAFGIHMNAIDGSQEANLWPTPLHNRKLIKHTECIDQS